ALPRDPGLPVVALSAGERARYAGTFVGRPPGGDAGPVELVVRVWDDGSGLRSTGIRERGGAEQEGDDGEGEPLRLFPLGEHAFAPGRDLEGLIHSSDTRYRFVPEDGAIGRLEIEVPFLGSSVVVRLERIAGLDPAHPARRRAVAAPPPATSFRGRRAPGRAAPR
ncbi:MAG: hypothetical protein KY453_05760, partial [Gemmatimonadetes bacterium]|nr:hypothetical protein [Gemmatimonadota bacterium]